MSEVCVVAFCAKGGEADGEVLGSVEGAVRQAFGLTARRLPPLPEPEGSFDAGRRQWSSPTLLRTLVGSRPPDAFRIVGVSARDLFIPVLSFVFGQAQVDGPAAVISLARLSQEFYGLPADRPLLLARARKEAVHELGHTFGLVHCPDPACPMSLSTSVPQVDRKGDTLCRSCAALYSERGGGKG